MRSKKKSQRTSHPAGLAVEWRNWKGTLTAWRAGPPLDLYQHHFQCLFSWNSAMFITRWVCRCSIYCFERYDNFKVNRISKHTKYFLKLPHCHFMGDLHTLSMSLSFLYVSVHSPDLLGNTSELAFRWIALLLSLQTRRLTEGSSIAPAPYSKEQEEIRETSPFSLIIFWGWVGGFKLVVFPLCMCIHLSKFRDTQKPMMWSRVRVRKKRHVFAAMFAGRESP